MRTEQMFQSSTNEKRRQCRRPTSHSFSALIWVFTLKQVYKFGEKGEMILTPSQRDINGLFNKMHHKYLTEILEILQEKKHICVSLNPPTAAVRVHGAV